MSDYITEWLTFDSVTGVDWENPSNALLASGDGASYTLGGAEASTTSLFFKGLAAPTGVPENHRLVGVEVRAERRTSDTSGEAPRDSFWRVNLEGAFPGPERQNTTGYTLDFVSAITGGPTDLFGLSESAWTDSFGPDFRMDFQAEHLTFFNITRDVFIRNVEIRFHYEEAVTFTLTAQGISTGSPTAANATFGQAHSLTATPLLLASPSVSTATLGQIHNLTATNIVGPQYDIGSPVIGQDHLISATDLLTASPIVPTVSANITFNLLADGITTPPAITGLPTLGQVHILTAVGVSARKPTLGQATLLIGDVAFPITTGKPTLGNPVISQQHQLSAQGVSTGAPQLGTPVYSGFVSLEALEITLASPEVGQPELSFLVGLLANGITTGSPTLASPFLLLQGSQFTIEVQGVFVGDRSVQGTWIGDHNIQGTWIGNREINTIWRRVDVN